MKLSIESLAREVRDLKREVKELKRGNQWMTVTEFIELTGVKRSTAWYYSSKGFFKKTRKGGLKFNREDVMKWLESQPKKEAA